MDFLMTEFVGFSFLELEISRNIRRVKGMTKYVRCNEVSLYWGSFPYILLLLGQRISFVVSRTLFYRGSLNRGSTLVANAVNSNNAGFREKTCKPYPTRSDRKSFNSHAKHIDPAILINIDVQIICNTRFDKYLSNL